MKIWFHTPPQDTSPVDGMEIGCFVAAGNKEQEGAAVEVISSDEALPETAETFVVPSGLGGHLDLLSHLAENSHGKLIFVALNGLGSKALSAAHQVLKGSHFIHLFDAQDQDHVSYLEQLSWLRSRDKPFAIMSRSTEKLLLAAAAGAEHLIVPDGSDVNLSDISRVAASAGAQSLRPVSATEVDHLAGREASLGVAQSKHKGETILENDLCVIINPERGLAPFLKGHVIGQRLRYGIEPGEPLHFGHLEEGEGND